jgi:crotonobetainyl-CoA:carnitine CoA-transferase CaiB-like acyl-CoA transferase
VAEAPEQALAGVRIVDFSRQMAAPYASLMLADFGADVIKVESLPAGDGSRGMGTDFRDGESALFLIWNRGKRSISLDLRNPEGLAVAHRLVEGADVLLENYRPGVAAEIGIGYEAMSALNPRLVYCSVSAFGSGGPWARQPGTDPVVQAMSGVMSVTGERGGGPVLTGVPIADFTGAMTAMQGILLALLARERTGRGQLVDISMLAALVSALTTRLANFWATGVDPVRNGSAHTVVAPYQAFATADGHIVAGSWTQDSWPRFCHGIGLAELIDDPRFATNPDRVRNHAELTAILDADFATRTSASWEEQFHRANALFGPVLTFSELFEHPQVQASGILGSVEHPTLGAIPQLEPAIRLSDTPGAIGVPPPLLGQHTREVLAEAGYGPAAIEDLIARRIAGPPPEGGVGPS